jgi:hypothetical protein
MKVQYIGQKAKKYDNVTMSTFVWTPGQVLDVPDDLGKTLVKYLDVWRESHEEAQAEAAPVLKTRPVKGA